HGARPEILTREHDVATKVVPREQAVERNDAADAVRLRVVDAALWVGVDLDGGRRVSHRCTPVRLSLRSTISNAARASSGCTESRQRPATGHIRGSQRKPRKSTRALYAYFRSPAMQASSHRSPTTARARGQGRK